MESYWQRNFVAVHEKANRTNIVRLHKAEIQVHYQYCNYDSQIERNKRNQTRYDLMLDALTESALFMQETKHGQLTGPIRLNLSCVKPFNDTLKQSLKLSEDICVAISALRSNYGRADVALPATTMAFARRARNTKSNITKT